MPYDISQQICEQVKHAQQGAQPISIHGSHSHDFMLPEFAESMQLNLNEHQGIVDYQPTELTVTALSGTRLEEIQQTLATEHQRLATDFPVYTAEATLGGAVSIGHTGSSRPYYGAIRDHILGASLVNTSGEIMHFGGKVMKNVAGYDVSRLLTGTRGTLGPILEITLKVQPLPEQQSTLSIDLDENAAIEIMNRLAGQSLPISASVYFNHTLFIRLEGTEAGIQQARKTINGTEVDDGVSFWSSIQQQNHDFFNSSLPIWRVIVPASTPGLQLQNQQQSLIDWCGGLRWVQASEITQADITYIAERGGYIESFRGSKPMQQAELMSPLQKQMHAKIKSAFDPDKLFNPKLSNFA
ncbi:MAG: glycolate oxidase subunit GlcE [Gammaproteobacteria bacterium]|jgi:glycolate oxidase FAD binding subunit|nr:glycolate oxidase subunit GlcE [Gammaproteobacteria bacterium]MBT3722804.1 glycolate oxidase subunit GlcE [Gammaproteobacteria bacterium]MBT4075157.1 glycolate oxidase subunit GlcE [Gammaproteobacteria bacterium]MBT4196037.1 glycolate oxidase subunit GlcE [Gammaproteobacteria bacterium]MBT4451647.1 glycolate oxidase subunit GlcE [Gammaproteobacteria bacterium]